MSSNPYRVFYDKLEKKEEYIPLLKQFIQRSIEDQYIQTPKKGEDEISFGQFYERFVESTFLNNAECVFNNCQSPIERMFLNSLMLLFLRNRMPCLFVTAPFFDTEFELARFRKHYEIIDGLIESYKEVTSDNELIYFEKRLKEKQEKGDFSEEEIIDILSYRHLRKTFEFNSYHITPQAAFPDFKIDNRSIRTDFFIWVPNDPSVKIIVECDGFEFHNTKASFINDRKRDRLFQLKGYRVIRYSGSELYNDPVETSSNLFDLLKVLDEDKDTRIV